MTLRSPSNLGSLAARLASGLFFLWLAACDSTTSTQDSLNSSKDTVTNVEREILDSLAFCLAGVGRDNVQDIASFIDPRTFDFANPRGDTTILQDYVTGKECSDSTVGELTTIECEVVGLGASTTKTAVFPRSSALDSVLDPSVDSSRRASLAGSLGSLLLRSDSYGGATHSTSEGSYFKEQLERIRSNGAIVTDHMQESGKMFKSAASSIRIRSNPGMPDAWLRGSRFKRATSLFEWDASDSGLTMIGGYLNGVATVKWSNSGGDSIRGTIRIQEGRAFVTELRARYARGYDSIRLESSGLLAMYQGADTSLAGWHDHELGSPPPFDSVSRRYQRVGTLWKDAKLSLRWDKPNYDRYDGTVTHVRLEATEADGALRTIVGDVVLKPSTGSSIWTSLSGSSSR